MVSSASPAGSMKNCLGSSSTICPIDQWPSRSVRFQAPSPAGVAITSMRQSTNAQALPRFRANADIAGTSRCQLLPPPPPPLPPLPACGVARSGCSALLAPAGLFERVSAPVAAPAPVDGDTVPVDPGPEVAVPGDAAGGEDEVVPEVGPVWAKAVAAIKSAAAVKRASFVMTTTSWQIADAHQRALVGRPMRKGNSPCTPEVPKAECLCLRQSSRSAMFSL